MNALALASGSKSIPEAPPGAPQVAPPKCRLFHVASPSVAGAPWPPELSMANLSPSPQDTNMRCRLNDEVANPHPGTWVTLNERSTDVMTAFAGMPEKSKSRRPRLRVPFCVVPARNHSSAPLLLLG